MKDIMIDIETLGLGENAVMIQMAAVFFNRHTGETGPTFCRSLSVESCEAAGFVKTESTVNWWKEQNQDVYNNIIASGEPAETVMNDFVAFLGPNLRNYKIWSHATFDFPIVNKYMTTFTKSWLNHKGARDIRTLVDLSEINLDAYDWSKKTHDALDDCLFQIKYCVDAMRKLK
jgi:hypothetical protein